MTTQTTNHTESPAGFGEIGALQDLFLETKQRRRSRHPQYVMIVEDDPVTRRVVSQAFKENYAIISAQNAHEAVSNYLLHAPDVVFLDIGLPDANGFAVLKQIISCDPEAYVVMFSGNDYPDNIAQAFCEGAMGFVAKPFKKESLSHYIRGSVVHHRKSCS